MATYTITGGSTTGLSSSAPKVRSASQVVDFSSTTNVANDVFECIELPANSFVISAGVDVITVDSAGNSGTIALGDGTDPDRFVTAAVPTSAGNMATRVQAGTSAAGASVGYALNNAADTVDITVATGAINAVVRVWAIVADVDGIGDGQGQKVTFA
tara:strand:+ start:168 stop:638 length:471 start_codon:yes stop_codon:yes gene_type:complete